MPFGFHVYPSIQLGTLSTMLRTHGHEVKSFYLNLHFAHQIDMEVYKKLCEERFLIGEWLFSHLLFGESRKNKEYTEHFKSHLENVSQTINRPLSFLNDVKVKMVPEFLNWAWSRSIGQNTMWWASPRPSIRTSPASPWPS